MRHDDTGPLLLGRIVPAAQNGAVAGMELDITSWKGHGRREDQAGRKALS
jgi:hypothetical protein